MNTYKVLLWYGELIQALAYGQECWYLSLVSLLWLTGSTSVFTVYINSKAHSSPFPTINPFP